MLKNSLKERFLMLKKAQKERFNYFIICFLCYNNDVGGMHGSASFVSNLEQLA